MMPAQIPRVPVAIVASSRLLREAIARRLAAESDLVVLAACPTLTDVLATPGANRIQVLLLVADGENRWTAFCQARDVLPQARCVVLLDDGHAGDSFHYIQAGALACVGLGGSLGALLDAIRAAAEGRVAASGAVLAALIRRLREMSAACQSAARSLPASLSDRELEVACLVARGLSNKQIARQLQIRITTVKTLVHRILKKLQLPRRRDVMLRIPGGETP